MLVENASEQAASLLLFKFKNYWMSPKLEGKSLMNNKFLEWISFYFNSERKDFEYFSLELASILSNVAKSVAWLPEAVTLTQWNGTQTHTTPSDSWYLHGVMDFVGCLRGD